MQNIQKLKVSTLQLKGYWLPLILLVILKLTLGAFFSSDYQSEIFIPFTTHFLKFGGNPWQYFYENNSSIAFPYPPLMLYLLAPGTFLASICPDNHLWTGFCMSLLSLTCDLFILRTIKKFVPKINLSHLLIWGLTPIVLFSCYAHSQLDLIPTSFLLASAYYLTRGRWPQSALLFGLSLSTKFHTLIALPFFIIYIYKRYGFSIKNAPQYLSFIFFHLHSMHFLLGLSFLVRAISFLSITIRSSP